MLLVIADVSHGSPVCISLTRILEIVITNGNRLFNMT